MIRRKILYILFFVFLVLNINSIAFAGNYESGIDCYQKKQYSQALKYFSYSVQEKRNDPNRLYYLGLTLKNIGEKQRAERAFKKALELNPIQSLKSKISSQISSLNSSKVSSNLVTSAKIRNMKRTTNLENYLEHVTPNGKVMHWDIKKMPLKVYISRGNGLNGFDPKYLISIKNAFNRWAAGTNYRIKFDIVGNENNADIKVKFLNGFEGHKIGENPFVSIKDVIVRSDINLSLSMPDGRAKTPQEMYNVALHEIGHAMGFQGHSPNRDDVMYYSLNPQNYNSRLTSRDLNTMKLLYRVEADISNNLPLDMKSTRDYYQYLLSGDKEASGGDHSKALSYYLQAEKLYKNDFDLQRNIAISYLSIAKYQNAIEHFKMADRLKQADPLVRYNMAVAMVQYTNSLPSIAFQERLNYYKDALNHLRSIANKPDCPPETQGLINQLENSLAANSN